MISITHTPPPRKQHFLFLQTAFSWCSKQHFRFPALFLTVPALFHYLANAHSANGECNVFTVSVLPQLGRGCPGKCTIWLMSQGLSTFWLRTPPPLGMSTFWLTSARYTIDIRIAFLLQLFFFRKFSSTFFSVQFFYPHKVVRGEIYLSPTLGK